MMRLLCAAAALLGIALSGCSHAPSLYTDSMAMKETRQEYVRNNPGGTFNDFILKGELAKGMDMNEVEAAWGLPDKRRDLEDESMEQWIYAAMDDVSNRVVVYSLAFQNRSLIHWDIHETVVTGKGIKPDLDNIPVYSPTGDDRANRDSAPIKK